MSFELGDLPPRGGGGLWGGVVGLGGGVIDFVDNALSVSFSSLLGLTNFVWLSFPLFSMLTLSVLGGVVDAVPATCSA